MADIAPRDPNRNVTVQATSSVDGLSPVNLWADPTSHALLVSATVTPSGTQDVNLTKIGGTSFALGQQLSTASLPVVLTAAQISTLTPLSTVAVTQTTSPWVISGTVDTELPTAVALANAQANPTAPAVGSFLMGYEHFSDRWYRIEAADASGENTDNSVIGVWANSRLFGYDGSGWDRMKGDSTDGLLVNLGSNNDVTVTSGTITFSNSSIAVTNAGVFATQSAITAASGSFSSGAFSSGSFASGSIASGAVASGAIASGAFASGSVSDGAIVTLGAKADAKSTATDSTAITIMQVLKQISASVQAPPSQAVTQSTSPWIVAGGGTAGTAASGVVTIQGITSMTPVQVSQATASNLNATVVGTGTFAAQVTGTVTANQGTANTATNSWPTLLTDGTNSAGILKSDGTAISQNAQITGSAYLSVAFTTTIAAAVGSTDAGNYRWVTVQIPSQGGSSTVTFQTSNDNTNWVSLALMQTTGTAQAAVTSTTSQAQYHGPLGGRYFRLNVTGIASGTTSGTIVFSANPSGLATQAVTASQSGTWSIQSNSATGSAVPANAHYIGISDAGTLRGLLQAANALNSTGTGIPTAQIVGQFDDTSPTSITENQFGNVRMSANRNLYDTIRDAAGNERGANVTASNQLTVIDTNFPTAAALADNIANPTTPAVGSFVMGMLSGGTTWARVASDNSDGDANSASIYGLVVNNRGELYNGSTWDLQRSGGVTGMTGVSGDTAHDAVDAGNPLKIGGYASSTIPTAVSASADRVNAWMDLSGRIPTFYEFTSTRISTNTTTTVKASAGLLHHITILNPSELSVANETVTIYNNTAGSGTVVGVLNLNDGQGSINPYTIFFGSYCSTGITLVTTGSTVIADFIVYYV